MRIHSKFLYGKIHSKFCMVIFVWVHYIVIFCMGKILTFFVCDFLRVIHSKFFVWKYIVKMYGNFCVCTT